MITLSYHISNTLVHDHFNLQLGYQQLIGTKSKHECIFSTTEIKTKQNCNTAQLSKDFLNEVELIIQANLSRVFNTVQSA